MGLVVELVQRIHVGCTGALPRVLVIRQLIERRLVRCIPLPLVWRILHVFTA
jgi:hypothetical protein